MEKRFAHALPLCELRDADGRHSNVAENINVFEVDQCLSVFVVVAAAAAVAATGASSYEVKFFVAQFNRVGKFMHVTLLCTLLGLLMAPY
jgi:hypothetical protein